MEVTFDNESNVLSAQIQTIHDHSVLYKVVTDQTLWSRARTYLKDANPALGESSNAGIIHWKENLFEIYGLKRPIPELRRKGKGLIRKKKQFWRWTSDRKEYTVVYWEDKQWRVTLNGELVAEFTVPYRPKLFSKAKPMVLELCPAALERDEVFLLLVLIYCEARRQDKMNASGGWQA